MKKYNTREEWLLAAIKLMTPLFKQHEYTVPEIKVACGWPSHGALSRRKRVLGQAWCKTASKDNVAQIFISPYLEDVTAPQGVLSVLKHEVVHAVVGNKEGHNKVFGKCARAVGLEGKLTSTHSGEMSLKLIADWSKELGAYPHSQLNMTKSPVKKQTTRMVKMECEACGYMVRTSRKWLEVGPCLCPVHKKPMKFDIPDELGGDDE